ncbi:S41 family peptidase [Thalassotalea sp. 1_MG-2023]|uniref:S41 family peptidase n=1 Tax=Thalassotalea sp. 1_MG-2023 TaxID=3062680 RepID=UPI0026E203A9|nr:S41 family peptidase [Thalassotalea sp. 1_MG-2023]MDO6426694.1 S41 family peptidase [Thalassotalea sp. 1_MG-2023]
MRYKKYALSALAIFATAATAVEKDQEWFLHSSISPDSKTIAFSYKGDIYTVPTSGGTARPLTIHSDWDGHPIWSSDGKNIAFASDRSGNLDVYIMPANGGKAKRLTYHSANDIPQDFTKNNKEVLFTSSRIDSKDSTIFPTARLTESYTVSVGGATPKMLATVPASELQFSPNGDQVLYRDEKSYENPFRKHDVSAFARDIWLHDLNSGKHQQLTTFKGGDHNPVWKNNNTFYYTSEEKSDVFNVWQTSLNGSNKKQITKFKQHPVRSLSTSENGTLAFVHHGSIYTNKNGSLNRVNVTIANDVQEDELLPVSLGGKITEYAVSPDGKEVAFIARGEVFVASTEFKTTRAITNTPQQERSVSFHKDGKTLLYAAERDDNWGLYETTIENESEPYFFAATTLTEKTVHLADTDSFQPVYSPDGKKIAFLSNRDEIQVIDRETKEVNVALSKENNYSYADGDISFAWAPDSYWMTANFAPRGRLFIKNVGIFPSDGSAKPKDISLSGYNDGSPTWHTDGNAVLWWSARFGQRDHGSWGREGDVLAAFLTQDSYDKFRMSKEEYELQKELEDKKEKGKKDEDKKDDEEAVDKTKSISPVEIDWENIERRTVRLTVHSSQLGQAYLTKDAKELYYLARFEKGFDLWRQSIKDKKTELVAKLNARSVNMSFSEDEKNLFILADGQLKQGKVGKKITLKSIKVNPVMQLKTVAEREFMFDHSWRVIKDKFYRSDYHGIDWDEIGKSYRKKLTSIGHGRDFANMFAEMTGELNASHIGSSYRPKSTSTNDKTGRLGLFFNDDNGLLVEEVLANGPFDNAESKVKPGVKLTAVNGVELSKNQNLYQLLNHTTGKRVRFTFEDDKGNNFDEVIKPVSARKVSNLLYDRWVTSREALVEKLSNGRLAYVHVRGMNDPSFRAVYSSLLGKHFDKEAVVVDTRFNGGGWLHNDLAKLLSGNEYFTMHVRGRQYAGDPFDQWNKPSVLLINEGNYSDAHAFAYTYDELDLGEMVGMPVPGTMTAVWWETGISGDFRAGVPQVGMKDTKGKYLENNQTMPDHMVKNDPESSSKGQDKQIEKAVEVLLKKLK